VAELDRRVRPEILVPGVPHLAEPAHPEDAEELPLRPPGDGVPVAESGGRDGRSWTTCSGVVSANDAGTVFPVGSSGRFSDCFTAAGICARYPSSAARTSGGSPAATASTTPAATLRASPALAAAISATSCRSASSFFFCRYFASTPPATATANAPPGIIPRRPFAPFSTTDSATLWKNANTGNPRHRDGPTPHQIVEAAAGCASKFPAGRSADSTRRCS